MCYPSLDNRNEMAKARSWLVQHRETVQMWYQQQQPHCQIFRKHLHIKNLQKVPDQTPAMIDLLFAWAYAKSGAHDQAGELFDQTFVQIKDSLWLRSLATQFQQQIGQMQVSHPSVQQLEPTTSAEQYVAQQFCENSLIFRPHPGPNAYQQFLDSYRGGTHCKVEKDRTVEELLAQMQSSPALLESGEAKWHLESMIRSILHSNNPTLIQTTVRLFAKYHRTSNVPFVSYIYWYHLLQKLQQLQLTDEIQKLAEVANGWHVPTTGRISRRKMVPILEKLQMKLVLSGFQDQAGLHTLLQAVKLVLRSTMMSIISRLKLSCCYLLAMHQLPKNLVSYEIEQLLKMPDLLPTNGVTDLYFSFATYQLVETAMVVLTNQPQTDLEDPRRWQATAEQEILRRIQQDTNRQLHS
ncbi:MAG: hypothetical protein R3B84_10340 [Zavarzinella sp.]